MALTLEQKRKARKPLLWIGIASMAMAFAGLTSGYVVSRAALLADGMWLEFALPEAFMWSTVVLVASSITLFLAVRASRKVGQGSLAAWMGVTWLLGLAFAGLQLMGYTQLTDQGIFFTGEGSNTAGSWVYAISFFHLLHLAAGIIALTVSWIKSIRGKYAENKLGLELTATFWHFLDVLWVYLYLFLVFIR